MHAYTVVGKGSTSSSSCKRSRTHRMLIGVGTANTKLLSSGCQEYSTGASAELAFPTHLGQHNLGTGCQWRQISGFDTNVPLSIRQQAGHSVKSFIKVS